MNIKFYIVVVSDTVFRDPSKDVSGKRACELITSKGFVVAKLDYIPNDYKEIVRRIMEVPSDVNIIILLGGTGPSPRDITVDVVESLAWRKLPGFGEIFRVISYNTEGAKAILSRAELFIMPNGKIVVTLPGSPRAVEIGLNILMDVAEHIAEEVKRFEGLHKTH
uniref:MogA/MoaB family molybdenum cofactor biosynthesis protein n=1 Tax=Ignisphaera aggregans TaxID=334771 RepID=A0A7C2ZNJ5_9CREN